MHKFFKRIGLSPKLEILGSKLVTGAAKPRKRKMIWVVLGAGVVLLLAQLLFLPLPRVALNLLFTNNAAWLLNDRERAGSIPERMARVFTGELLQQSIVAHLHDRFGKRVWRDDAAYAGALLHRLRPTLISQREIYHTAVGTPPVLSGLGWCDELNGVAGRLLAHDFDRVEIVGVNPTKPGMGGHSFGRFWSKQYNDWLYFDIWTEEVLLFRVLPGATVDYLFRSSPVGPSVVSPDDFVVISTYHANAKQGFVHVRYQNSLAGHIGSRLWNFVSHGSTTPYEALAPIKAIVAREKLAGPSKRIPPRYFNRQIQSYSSARLAHMAGDSQTAQALYRRAVRNDPKSSYGLASAKFLDRLSHSPQN